ncbi:MAG TPA: lysylphosphatidylglycerol synthase transmembrane domain-containing protein [Candidatus Cloacimonadota bacterium]|nr:lysylphosphatidylglycerol synthase transmembrane domain-containing protein [Candidatus Cloacimonadota bacterium]
MPKKSVLSLIVGLILGLILIALWFSYTEFDQILLRIRDVNTGLVVRAAIVYVLAYFIRSVRWNLLLGSKLKISLFRTWLYSMGGNFVNYMIPIRLGELVKAWFIKRNHSQAVSSSLPSIFIDKSFDTLGIFFVLIMLPFLAVKLSVPMMVLLSLLALVFIVSLVIILFAAKEQKRVLGWFEWLLKLFPAKLRIKLQSFVDLFLQGLNIFEHHWSVLVAALGLTAVGVLLDGFYFFSLFRAFGLQDSFLIVLFGYTLINLSYALPQPPAQLGSNEWMMIIVFSIGFGLTKESASSIMVFAHILTALIMSILGLIAFSFSGYDVIKSIYKDESGYESN